MSEINIDRLYCDNHRGTGVMIYCNIRKAMQKIITNKCLGDVLILNDDEIKNFEYFPITIKIKRKKENSKNK